MTHDERMAQIKGIVAGLECGDGGLRRDLDKALDDLYQEAYDRGYDHGMDDYGSER